ncbi:helix-turn-helix transcriptional regulator [Sphingobacterium humi]|uniref:Helix-turn-helix domain-containing protein n=1 Tax=Sphingobacterium humi TaxID=1796905 RepID=A0A6N8KU93_9SPHI|nr:response regulator transcription factor [Sphingobacterium humi]MVZ60657.1 helix-turn-helix domain-containing protein [Sphingobacterium humi]
MIIKAKIKEHNEWLFWEELSEDPNLHTTLSEKQVSINKYPISISTYQILSKGIFIIQAEMLFNEAMIIQAEIDQEAIVSQFVFSLNPQGKPIFSKHNIRYIPSLLEEHLVPEKQKCLYVLLVMTPSFYHNLVTIYNPLQDQFKQRMNQQHRTSIFDEDLPATLEMLHTIEELNKVKEKKELKQIFTNAKVLELIMYQFEQFGLVSEKEVEEVKTEDIVKLEEAKKLLTQQFVEPPTHKQLSKIVLLNEFKLRTGFKKYFGTTIYHFITRLRMEEAKRLILDEGKNMYEVGTLVGFKHQASFTHAFKRYYGILPSEIFRNN